MLRFKGWKGRFKARAFERREMLRAGTKPRAAAFMRYASRGRRRAGEDASRCPVVALAAGEDPEDGVAALACAAALAASLASVAAFTAAAARAAAVM